MVDGDLKNEEFIFQKSNLILSRFSNDIISKYKGKTLTNHFTVFPTVCSDTPLENKLTMKNKKTIDLVYIGSLIPKNSSHPKNLFPIATMPEAWELILNDERFNIHIYNSPFRSFDENGMEDIINLKLNIKI